MRTLVSIIVICLFSILSFSQESRSETTCYYLIRHAEKDRSDQTNADPDLLEIGQQRAEQWRDYLKDIKFDAVYSTDYNRTKQTALPTAKANNLQLQYYNPNSLYSKEFQQDTKGKTVLIVGHSNTTPSFVNAIIGEEQYEAIDDKTNSNLYVVKISEETVTHDLITVN
ncbi:histidine phosphatase family protein [Sediminibacter sp. Hel_I_10]|uniref:SixA phosphatase family protein n=1 Tax=Sediminibacter sp. Hel_I_10 TaxID=1392490 RepID=UPI00047DF786|nr:phosphoglycerate mutase family protein [Sediminibacter sp. Hel_I_10]